MRRHDARDHESGSALIWALLFVIVTAGMVISHAAYMAANRRQMEVRYRHTTLANTFARSGLTDAISWYQQQVTQPVTNFNPQLNPSGDPPKMETLDPTIGLVREFEIRGNLWGRYEVRNNEVADISQQRGMTVPGSVWDVGSRGYVYRVMDPAVPFDQAPNRLVAATYVRTEMRGIPLMVPAQAAVAVDDPGAISVGPKGKIKGGGNPAFAYPDDPSLGSPGSFPSFRVSGTPPTVAILNYNSAAKYVFSMRLDQLRSLADMVIGSASGNGGDGAAVSDADDDDGWGGGGGSGWGGWGSWQGGHHSGNHSGNHSGKKSWRWRWRRRWFGRGQGQTNTLPQRLPRDLVVFVDGDLTLQADENLTGRMMLVVNGDFTAEKNNGTQLEGLIYVTGDVEIKGPFTLKGMLVTRGEFKIGYGGGSAGAANINYDDASLQVLKKAIAKYRPSRSVRPGWTKNE